ncbi:LysR family transcriptional regulator [Bordetella sp. 15P40C-2]|uniref:LysR family transcriptional regulator n=1 Tax=Bordetella sp. 15P40C-2 TaxID=2572246 RepID=UPI001324D5BC|nr:LysR family transcriptional regulator [Bordetella sp. 15P40C-2]MVW71509.1 LysR family transcriptional regulator [Bordetella sp. 15P40C-2]
MHRPLSPSDVTFNAFTIAQLRTYLLVAEHGSYRAAAQKIFRSQSAVSRSIAELEERLGRPLFEPAERTKLSDFGRQCLPVVRELVEHFDNAARFMLAQVREQRSALSVGVIQTVARRWLPHLVQCFHARCPGAELRIVDDNSSRLAQMVQDGEITLALCGETRSMESFEWQPLFEDRFGFVCTHTHPFAKRDTLSWRELSGQPLIGTTTHSVLTGLPQEIISGSQTVWAANMLSLWSLVRQGVGVSILPAMSLPSDTSEFVFVPVTQPVVTRSIGLLGKRNAMLDATADSFRQIVVEFFDNQPSNSAKSRLNATG